MSLAIIGAHAGLALALFFLVNWIGKHAVDFGYASVSLFETPSESVALNFFLRALSPAVFIIALSAAAVAVGWPNARFGIERVTFLYYGIRFAAIFVLNKQGLVSWPRFAIHTAAGVIVAMLAYRHLIIPNRSLLPDLDAAGNELWLAILAFLYAVANKVPLHDGAAVRRRNAFVRGHFIEAERRFGAVIESKIADDLLRLVTYAVLIYEDHCRPPAIRWAERAMWWRDRRTTGIMQVADAQSLSDMQSVDRGTDLLLAGWATAVSSDGKWSRVRATVAAYNRDEDYVGRVMEVMEIIAKRAAPRFEAAYQSMFE